MTFRDFFRITCLAMDGTRVLVPCLTARDAKREFDEYVSELGRYGTIVGWSACGSVGNCHVSFDGRGSVRFSSTAGRSDGYDIEYVTTDECEHLRHHMRSARGNDDDRHADDALGHAHRGSIVL